MVGRQDARVTAGTRDSVRIPSYEQLQKKPLALSADTGVSGLLINPLCPDLPSEIHAFFFANLCLRADLPGGGLEMDEVWLVDWPGSGARRCWALLGICSARRACFTFGESGGPKVWFTGPRRLYNDYGRGVVLRGSLLGYGEIAQIEHAIAGGFFG